jgi:arylsulfatase A-like enzyme
LARPAPQSVLPDEAPTIATALKALGYETGRFGKNHLGDLNRYLPTVHGFDEYFGYLYHLDAMEDPFWHSCPAALKGKQFGDRNYKVHLDGYDQTNVLTGKGPSNRHELFYFAEGTLGAVRLDDWKFRLIDQPEGWLGGTVKPDMPLLTNLRLDPYERMGFIKGNTGSFQFLGDFYVHGFVFLQQKVGEYAQNFIDLPPMQRGRASISKRSRRRSRRGSRR